MAETQPDCGLGPGHRNLNFVHDIPSHYALSFYEVSSNFRVMAETRFVTD